MDYANEFTSFQVLHPEVSITSRLFGQILVPSFTKSKRGDTITQSFIKTGIWPVDRFQISDDYFKPSTIYKEQDANIDFERTVVATPRNDSLATVPPIDGAPRSLLVDDTNLHTPTGNLELTPNQDRAVHHKPTNSSVDLDAQPGPSNAPCASPPPDDSLDERSFSCKTVEASTEFSLELGRKRIGSSIVSSVGVVDVSTHAGERMTSTDIQSTPINSQVIQNPVLTLPGASKSVMNSPIPFPAATSTPASTEKHPVKEMLDTIEKALGPSKTHIYRNRFLEEYDLPGDSCYESWKVLYQDWIDIKKSIVEETCFASSLQDDIDPILKTICTIPEVERKAPTRKKLKLPRNMSSDNAIKILRLQNAEKKRLLAEKEARRMQRRKKAEEKGAKLAKKKPKVSKKQPNPPKAKATPTLITISQDKDEEVVFNTDIASHSTRSIRTRRPKTFLDHVSDARLSHPYLDTTSEESDDSDEEYGTEEKWFCEHCQKEERKGQLWVSCDVCDGHFHVKCTDLNGKDEDEVKEIDWKCDLCLDL